MLNAAAVRRLGVARLNGLNSGRGYADGGLVTTSYIAANHDAESAQTSEAAGVRGNSINLNISAMDAVSFGDFLNRGGLDVVKQALFDSNRNFASEAGVW